MTAPFKTYEEPEFVQGDTYRAHEHYGAEIVVKIKQHKDGIVTPNSPDGAPGVIVDLVDLGDGKTYRDVLFMGGAMVDGLKRYLGGLVVVTIQPRKSKSNRTYPAPEGTGDEGIKRAQAWIAKNGDPFTAAISTPSNDDKPPF